MALDILKSDWWMTHVSKNPLNLLFCVKIVSARCHLEGDDAVLLLMDYSQKKEFLLHFIPMMPSLSF